MNKQLEKRKTAKLPLARCNIFREVSVRATGLLPLIVTKVDREKVSLNKPSSCTFFMVAGGISCSRISRLVHQLVSPQFGKLSNNSWESHRVQVERVRLTSRDNQIGYVATSLIVRFVCTILWQGLLATIALLMVLIPVIESLKHLLTVHNSNSFRCFGEC